MFRDYNCLQVYVVFCFVCVLIALLTVQLQSAVLLCEVNGNCCVKKERERVSYAQTKFVRVGSEDVCGSFVISNESLLDERCEHSYRHLCARVKFVIKAQAQVKFLAQREK